MAFWKWMLAPLELYTPELLKRMVICRLTTLCAAAFQCPVPGLKGLSANQLLENYARFTENAIRERLPLNNDGRSALRNRLYQQAFQTGQRLRDRFGPADLNDALRLLRFLYRMIKIDLQSDPQANGIIISQCFFSRYYSSEVCQIMSAFDQGLAAGLSGGTSLEFQGRITDGCEFCRAYWRENRDKDKWGNYDETGNCCR
jgi:hypothetical protein